MNKYTALFILLVCFIRYPDHLNAQSLPVGTPVLEDYYRNSQLLGRLDSSISFTVRPLFQNSLKTIVIFPPDSIIGNDRTEDLENVNRHVQLLPFSWQQQYNSDHPYGWNDGSMIRARGYQTMVSAGVYVKYGPLSIQLKPEFVFAENKAFTEFATFYNYTDLPERYGTKPYHELAWGQSSVRLNLGPISLGLSNENLWWGPGIRNSLVMSNSASGFKHLTLNTLRPVRTAIGSFEGQIIAGRLEGSGLTPPKPDDWRYLSAMVFTYQPKWIPGLFLGLTRSFQIYSKDLGTGFGDYFPLIAPFQKDKTDNTVTNSNSEDLKNRDQLVSVFSRWVLTKAKAEVYFEYGLNDHSYNIRDFLMSPEHSAAYLFGMRKLFPYRNRRDEYIQFSMEFTRLEQSEDRIIRDAGAWYLHSQVIDGYTNKGEVLGAGIGPGSNLQSFELSWLKGLKHAGIQLERYVHNNDYYYSTISTTGNKDGQWVDLSGSAFAGWTYKNLLFNANIQGIHSIDYQWSSDFYNIPKKNVFNLHMTLGTVYRF